MYKIVEKSYADITIFNLIFYILDIFLQLFVKGRTGKSYDASN